MEGSIALYGFLSDQTIEESVNMILHLTRMECLLDDLLKTARAHRIGFDAEVRRAEGEFSDGRASILL